MIHDLTVPKVNPVARKDGHAQFGAILPADADALKKIGAGHNVPGAIFTVDGTPVHFPSASDEFPQRQTNVVPIYLSMGAYNSLQQMDAHPYWEFNYLGTNWVHPLYELPFTGGFPDSFWRVPGHFRRWRDRSTGIHSSGVRTARDQEQPGDGRRQSQSAARPR